METARSLDASGPFEKPPIVDLIVRNYRSNNSLVVEVIGHDFAKVALLARRLWQASSNG